MVWHGILHGTHAIYLERDPCVTRGLEKTISVSFYSRPRLGLSTVMDWIGSEISHTKRVRRLVLFLVVSVAGPLVCVCVVVALMFVHLPGQRKMP